MNDTMQTLLLKVHQMRFPGEPLDLNGTRSTRHIRFKDLYNDFISKDPNSITWNYISEYAIQTKNCKNCLFLVIVLLEEGYGLKDHKVALMRLYPHFISISHQHTLGSWDNLFSADKIEDIFMYEISKGSNGSNNAKRAILYLPYKNKYIQKEMFQHYQAIGRTPQNYTVKFTLLFEESLSGMELNIGSIPNFV